MLVAGVVCAGSEVVIDMLDQKHSDAPASVISRDDDGRWLQVPLGNDRTKSAKLSDLDAIM